MDDLPSDWTAAQRSLFYRMFSTLVGSPSMFQHPDAKAVPAEHWATTAYNASVFAVFMMSGDKVVVVDKDNNEIPLGSGTLH